MDYTVSPALTDEEFQQLLHEFTNQDPDQLTELAQVVLDNYGFEQANTIDDSNLQATPPADADDGEYNPLWKLEGAEMISRDIELINVLQSFRI